MTGSDSETQTGETGGVEAATDTARAVIENVERVIVGQRDAVEQLVTALLAGGHVLLEDIPGVGKTMLARAIADSFDGEFRRIQFTPDLLPSDVTGVNVYDQQNQSFEFRAGPVFANVVLGDEINRAPPKTQSALLEAMEERQVTVDGETRDLPDPFTVIATQNTVEGDRAYDLPMAQIDRFMKKLELGYPGSDNEVEMLDRVVGTHPIDELEPVASVAELRAARTVTAEVTVSEALREYATRLATHTRSHAQLGISPRGTIALVRAAQARAVLEGRGYAVPEDVQIEAPAVLSHRLRTDGDRDGAELIDETLTRVPVE